MDQQEKDYIKKLYAEGKSHKDIREITKRATATIGKVLKGFSRTPKEAIALAKEQGKWKLSDAGRQRLSEHGKRLCRKTGTCWTLPERQFKEILNELGIGVKFPDYIKEIFDLKDDNSAEIHFQYPLQRYVCDFVDLKRRIVYAVDGDFWHANPLLYGENRLTKIQKHNVARDKNRRVFLEGIGFSVCNVWESEIKWNKNFVIERIRATRKLETPPALQADAAAFDSLVAHSDWSERLKALWFKKPKGRPKLALKEHKCKFCSKVFNGKLKRKYCTHQCHDLDNRKVDRPNVDELNKMLWEIPTQQIAKLYGVSDKAVAKWAKSYGLKKPPRGFWSKKNCN